MSSCCVCPAVTLHVGFLIDREALGLDGNVVGTGSKAIELEGALVSGRRAYRLAIRPVAVTVTWKIRRRKDR